MSVSCVQDREVSCPVHENAARHRTGTLHTSQRSLPRALNADAPGVLGNDTVRGDAGDDRLYGGAGIDLLNGGPSINFTQQ